MRAKVRRISIRMVRSRFDRTQKLVNILLVRFFLILIRVARAASGLVIHNYKTALM